VLEYWKPETIRTRLSKLCVILWLYSLSHKSRAEARATGRAVSRERQSDWDGPMAV
jgi:hypothetical protein